eukprot:TRINITY_DN29046_c0_g1_i1.p1 TRINITY_DN29046_c0_g1~~TRINITY_DN29046_c0_g1_i1.p1  ORF type:complete len:402 (+),score=44.52 TRINITY_DN29046_c0_g1_i1:238-1443(+)
MKRKLESSANAGGGDMFDTSTTAVAALNSARSSARALGVLNKELGSADGAVYYSARIGELMASRYLVTETDCGKGVYSSIVKAKDQDPSIQEPRHVAIKVVRKSALMRTAAENEARILQSMQAVDGDSKQYIVHLYSHFVHQGHFCLVFESMWDDLREALRRLTGGNGMTLSVVRAYTQQLLLGLRHLKRCKVLHGDIKPDNILVNEQHTIVKLCDFGTAKSGEVFEPTAYLMSRYYRAPEIIIGCRLDVAVDMFALGCTLYEIFTGKVLLPGRSNHDQLRREMALLGMPPSKMISSGTFSSKYFDDKHKLLPEGPAGASVSAHSTGHPDPSQDLQELVLKRVGPERCKSAKAEDQLYVERAKLFTDLLRQALHIDSQHRVLPDSALRHRFFASSSHKAKT